MDRLLVWKGRRTRRGPRSPCPVRMSKAQQDGEPTAAEAVEAAAPDADATEPTADSDGLIEEARTALAAGDEDACRTAVE